MVEMGTEELRIESLIASGVYLKEHFGVKVESVCLSQ